MGGGARTHESEPSRSLAFDITLYTVARFGMLAALTAALVLFDVPLLVALAVSVVVAMPLSLFVFGGLRRRVATGMAQRAERRRAQRAHLRAQLRGSREGGDPGEEER
ncbi:uncharacterized protein DUF4229 [Halopolyspora algeriensis]|uniref:Uncharacterized protein DUF4229 n=1 Tax=Halopolyspora algeriensis TaxID=1500506 RepID=A0A368W2G6_9ACTN|nr:uncharacterized protein DUF4229 [Halopolyspora algeriensis]TQM47974.1 uncharacterized protein DUF4229 [Halopolyspora algeriensis]